MRQYSGVCAVRFLPQREIRRGGSGRLFRGEHRTFDIRYVPRTHGEHLVRADGAGGAHDFRDRDKQRHRFVRSDALRERYYRHCADYSCLYDMQKEEIIYEKYLSKEKVLELVDLCEKNSIYYNIYTESSVIAKSLNYNVAFYNYENTKKSSDKKTEINIVDDVYNYVKDLNTNKFLKMTICDENKIVFSSILRKVKNIPDIDVLEVSHMSKKKIKMGTKEISVGYYYTEISSENVDKWYAIEEIMKKENIKREEVISFGDNNNDILMIKNAGLGIAMGHSNEQVKEVAKFVTKTNDEDGVAKALENIILL